VKKINLLLIAAFMLTISGVKAQDHGQAEPINDHSLLYGRMFAQGIPDDNELSEPGRGAFDGKVQQRRKHLEQLRILKMLELLELNQEQELPFLTAFQETRNRMKEIHREKRELFEKLTPELHVEKPDEEKILSLIDQIKDIEERIFLVRREFIKTTGPLLTPNQLGRLIVFQERFDAELLEQVRHFRGRGNNDRFEKPGPRGF